MAAETKTPAGRDRSVRPTARAMGPVTKGTQTACRARPELLFGVWTPLTHVHGAGPTCNTGSTYGVLTFKATRTSDVRFARLLRYVLHGLRGGSCRSTPRESVAMSVAGKYRARLNPDGSRTVTVMRR
jgi:hypothetical protein